MTERYDVIIVGSGAGGGTLAHTLAPSGKRILLLERGDFLPRELANWDPGAVFVDGKYMSGDTWYDADGKPFQPQVHYFVGGATKMYGAALYRLRPEDFGEHFFDLPFIVSLGLGAVINIPVFDGTRQVGGLNLLDATGAYTGNVIDACRASLGLAVQGFREYEEFDKQKNA